MRRIVETLESDFSNITFEKGDTFMWSPADKTIHYNPSTLTEENGLWSLLHELGHAELNHRNYKDDLELLIMEVSAWKKAKELAGKYSIEVSDDHIDDCLETYRAWLHKRSKCVECGIHSFQIDSTTYQCHNCNTKWHVSASRLCEIRKTRIK